MDIHNVQVIHKVFCTEGGKSSAGKDKISVERNTSELVTTRHEVQKNTLNDNSSIIDIYCPPFFPMGHTQGIYEVMAKESESRSSNDSMAGTIARANKNKAANENDDATQQQITSEKNDTNNGSTFEVNETTISGNVLDLKV